MDLNLRANRAGFCCLYVPRARVYHIGSATTGSKFNDLTIKLSTRNSLYLLAKNYPLSLLLRYGLIISIYQCCWLLFVIKKQRLRSYLAGMAGVWGNVRRMRQKFHRDREQTKASMGEYRALLNRAEGEAVDSIMRRRAALNKGNGLLRLYRRLFF